MRVLSLNWKFPLAHVHINGFHGRRSADSVVLLQHIVKAFHCRFYTEMRVEVFTFVLLFSVCVAVQLKVGIYNDIPDLNNDQLASYKNLIESGFNNQDHTVDAVVNPSQYSPYDGNLDNYLSADGFDLIEMDTADLNSVYEKGLIMEVPSSLPTDLLQSAVSAVVINGRVYAYPTLVCGNFLISLTPKFATCNIMQGQSGYTEFYNAMAQCQEAVKTDSQHTWERLLGGKMNDKWGWYLPSLYLDGYIDIHGEQSLDEGIDEVMRGIVDPMLCERLSWLIGNCNNLQGDDQNKCYYKFPGSYVDSSSNVYPDVENYKTYIYFGFSEKVAQIEMDSDRVASAALSGPLGQQNNLLQFTDALVINKARWNAANEEKQNAIIEFVQYFLSNTLRTQIAMGKDLNQPRPRYLLQATETFYEGTNDVIYQDIYWSLKRAVASPSLSDAQKSTMQGTLTQSCVKLPGGKANKRGKSKQEL